MNDLISVIVPVYNVELYLERCVGSITAQTYKNMEIILVDDGSTDRSGKICDELKNGDSRIRVIHKANGGLSDARNCGVAQSCGKYITFIDSDDYVSEFYIEYLYRLLTENSADIACCDRVKTDSDTAAFDDINEGKSLAVTGKKACDLLLDSNLYIKLVVAWGKLYRADIVRAHPFPVGKKHEDEATTYRYFYSAEKVAYGYCKLYAYYQNSGGIMKTMQRGINEDKLNALHERALFFEKQGEKRLAKQAWSKFAFYFVTTGMQNNTKYDALISKYIKYRKVKLTAACQLVLYKYLPGFYTRLYKIKSRNYSD